MRRAIADCCPLVPHLEDRHYSPCGNRLGCKDNIIHLFSMSKSFGMAGWRVGYAVYPSWASKDMVKIQDTLPTHACTASQKIALAALDGEGEVTLTRSSKRRRP